MKKFTKDSFARNLSKGQLLAPYLERFNDYSQPWNFTLSPKEEDTAWHPSGDCIPSALSLYEKANGKDTFGPISPSLARSFQVGHFWHQLLQHIILNELGFCDAKSVERTEQIGWGEAFMTTIPKYQPYHWVKGAGDIAPLVLPSGWEGILDIKTMRSGDFLECKKSGLLPYRFAQKYEAQINIYMELFGMDKGLILGVNKDSPHDFIEFEFERNTKLIDAVFDKWHYVSECLDANEEPDPKETFALVFTGPIG
jgi:hypothetical protein